MYEDGLWDVGRGGLWGISGVHYGMYEGVEVSVNAI